MTSRAARLANAVASRHDPRDASRRPPALDERRPIDGGGRRQRGSPLSIALAALLLATPGCGTLLTARAGSHESFSGCKADLAVIAAPFVLGMADPTFLTGLPFCLAAGLIDLPLSFVGDLCVVVGHAGDRQERQTPEVTPRSDATTVEPTTETGAAEPGEVALAQSEPPSLTIEVGTCDPR